MKMQYSKKLLKYCIILLTLGLVITTQGCSLQKPVENDTKTGLFKYDPSKALNVQELSVRDEGGIKIREISFDAYDANINIEGTVNAYVVVPKGKGPFPAVLYLHWLGEENSNKDEFLDQSIELAKKGVVGLLIDGYFPWKVKPNGDLKNDKSLITYQVIELRRALDYLTSLSYVDTKRLAYVGHDYGAMFGTVLSGADKRIKYYNLTTGMGNFSDWFLAYWVTLDQEGAKTYRKSMSEMDPITSIKKTNAEKLFFQFSNNDNYITKEVADEFYKAAPQPKEVKYYDVGHDMILDIVKADRQKWLLKCLVK